MPDTPEVVDVTSEPLYAASRSVESSAEISPTIISLLDQVWPAIRSAGVTGFGHNVVMYTDHGMSLTAGVQVPEEAPDPTAPVHRSSTPSGRAATVTYVGPYTGIAAAMHGLITWASEQGHRVADRTWEIYGDWTDDESKLTTELFVSVN